eukprot:CAMPEP_0118636836 /NCGR_PEP_ID=MMETSP0785-20121206/2841_1 /TAXON_ID=91992 /ORGANISM="Bolidomonas pacifica, Strain CCMP 1866" /LENGTH=1709 /DNA_ID=CAMNT_0006528001 /DNA_START=559 /DNA_END=5688 /DNA_ORIENTATION=-
MAAFLSFIIGLCFDKVNYANLPIRFLAGSWFCCVPLFFSFALKSLVYVVDNWILDKFVEVSADPLEDAAINNFTDLPKEDQREEICANIKSKIYFAMREIANSSTFQPFADEIEMMIPPNTPSNPELLPSFISPYNYYTNITDLYEVNQILCSRSSKDAVYLRYLQYLPWSETSAQDYYEPIAFCLCLCFCSVAMTSMFEMRRRIWFSQYFSSEMPFTTGCLNQSFVFIYSFVEWLEEALQNLTLASVRVLTCTLGSTIHPTAEAPSTGQRMSNVNPQSHNDRVDFVPSHNSLVEFVERNSESDVEALGSSHTGNSPKHPHLQVPGLGLDAYKYFLFAKDPNKSSTLPQNQLSTKAQKKLCYNPYFIMMFEHYSQSRYSKVEEKFLKSLLECACTPSSYWSRCDYKNIPYLIYELKRIPLSLMKGSPKNTFAAGGVGIIDAPMCHVASFLWDFNTDYRKRINIKSDLIRKIVPMTKQSDHSITYFVRKWLPPPLSPRDFYLYQNWKRLDEKRIVIFHYDRDDGSYEEEIQKLSDRLRNQGAVRGHVHGITILEEYNDENDCKIKTKMSVISVINANGYLPKWVVRTRRSITLAIIQETMDYFAKISGVFEGNSSGYEHVVANNLAQGEGNKAVASDLYLSNQNPNITPAAFMKDLSSNTNAIDGSAINSRAGSREYGENPDSVVSQYTYDDNGSVFEDIENSAASDDHASKTSFAVYLKRHQDWNIANDNPDEAVINFNELSEKSLLQQNAIHSKSISPFPFFDNYYVKFGLQGVYAFISTPTQSDIELRIAETQKLLEYDLFKGFRFFYNARGKYHFLAPFVLIIVGAVVAVILLSVIRANSNLTTRSDAQWFVDLVFLYFGMCMALACPAWLMMTSVPHMQRIMDSAHDSFGGLNALRVKERIVQKLFFSFDRAWLGVRTGTACTLFLGHVVHFAWKLVYLVHGENENNYHPADWHHLFLSPSFLGLSFLIREFSILLSTPMRTCIYICLGIVIFLLLKTVATSMNNTNFTPANNLFYTAMESSLDDIQASALVKDAMYPVSRSVVLLDTFLLVLSVVHATSFAISVDNLRSFLTRMDFSFMWKKEYSKYLHWEKNLLARKELQPARAAYYTAENIFKKRRHELHKKFQFPLRYRDIEFMAKVGNGSSAVVYMARYRNNIVAVKELVMTGTTTEQMLRFLAEMELMANLKHPNILRLEGVVCEFPKVCMLLEYAKSGNLTDVMTTHPFLDWMGAKWKFAHCISSAMNYLHTRSTPILHRDLKTRNVLLTEWGVVKLSDFGESIALRGVGEDGGESKEHEEILSSEKPVGTMFFMAPEVIRGEKYTKECDVYSYGCVLADIAMSGRLRDLFLANTDKLSFSEEAMVKKIVLGWRPKLPEIWKRQFPVIASLVSSCWAVDDKARPTFAQIYSTISAWNGQKATIQMPDQHMVYTLRQTSELSALEKEVLQEGLKDLMTKKKSTEATFAFTRKTKKEVGSSFFVSKKMNHLAWEINELTFSWCHPERERMGWINKDAQRRVVQCINEHHHVVLFTWEKRFASFPVISKDFYCRLIWHEISQGTYCVVVKTLPKKKGEILKISAVSTILIEPCLDGSSCIVSFSSKMTWKDGFVNLVNDDDYNSLSHFLTALEEALDRKKNGEWEKYLDPEYVNPYFDEQGFRRPKISAEAMREVRSSSLYRRSVNWKIIGNPNTKPFGSIWVDESNLEDN